MIFLWSSRKLQAFRELLIMQPSFFLLGEIVDIAGHPPASHRLCDGTCLSLSSGTTSYSLFLQSWNLAIFKPQFLTLCFFLWLNFLLKGFNSFPSTVNVHLEAINSENYKAEHSVEGAGKGKHSISGNLWPCAPWWRVSRCFWTPSFDGVGRRPHLSSSELLWIRLDSWGQDRSGPPASPWLFLCIWD